MPNNISKNVLKEIKAKDIKPKAKWRFLLKKSVVWFSFGLCALIGGLAMSVIIFMLVSNDWDLQKNLGNNFIEFLFKTLPYIWIVIFVMFMSIAYYNFKHTSKGYKYKLSVFALSSLLISLLLGFAFFGMGVAKKIEKQALNNFPKYQELTLDQKKKLWQEEGKGILAGKIKSIESELEIALIDWNKKEWTVILPKPVKMLQVDDALAIFGEIVEDGKFKAKKARPWKGNFDERK